MTSNTSYGGLDEGRGKPRKLAAPNNYRSSCASNQPYNYLYSVSYAYLKTAY